MSLTLPIPITCPRFPFPQINCKNPNQTTSLLPPPPPPPSPSTATTSFRHLILYSPALPHHITPNACACATLPQAIPLFSSPTFNISISTSLIPNNKPMRMTPTPSSASSGTAPPLRIPTPPIEFKLSLQRNRRTSWRLSPTISSTHYPDPPIETPSTVDFPADDEDGELIGTVAGEVMRIARELPDNMTIGEALEGFQGGKKLTHWECLEVLKQMEKHAMVGCTLYFFEWMMMQVPSPISGKACSVFFGGSYD